MLIGKNKRKVGKKALVLFFAFLLSINSFASIVSDNDGAAFVTKAEFDSLKKNDKVMTSSGIIALVHSVDKEAGEVVLKVDDSNNTKIRFSIQSVYYIFPEKTAQKPESPEK